VNSLFFGWFFVAWLVGWLVSWLVSVSLQPVVGTTAMPYFSWLIIVSKKKPEFDDSKAHVCLMVAIVLGPSEECQHDQKCTQRYY
jgi:hypothetical protein